MLETPDPRSETRAFCQQIVTDVALARGSGDVGARVATLHTAVLAYPAYPDGEDTPLEGWLRELQELAQATGSRELAEKPRLRRAMPRVARISSRRIMGGAAAGAAGKRALRLSGSRPGSARLESTPRPVSDQV